MERLPKGVNAFVVRSNEVDLTIGEVFCRYNVSPNPENPVLYALEPGTLEKEGLLLLRSRKKQ
ncbi:uncharacterized protein K441DRAFT_376668 [Cenococcum geophilum 1.58]|uniref:uncharacterized protein n=1 Tax=Cenococcum geophilum 1.58 TaxID=794803 RepID=UPI000DC978A2|nr:hypothetical protein K441DRAFT_376668 [Cenococcum geophilum 1.58]